MVVDVGGVVEESFVAFFSVSSSPFFSSFFPSPFGVAVAVALVTSATSSPSPLSFCVGAGVDALLDPPLSSSRSLPTPTSNSFGSGPRPVLNNCCAALPLRWRGVVRVDARRDKLLPVPVPVPAPVLLMVVPDRVLELVLELALASCAERWRACSSAMRASIAPRRRCKWHQLSFSHRFEMISYLR